MALAAMLKLPLVVLALNNGGWDSVRDTQLLLHGNDRELATDFRNIGTSPYFADLAGFARSLGCDAQRIEDPAEIGPALTRAFASDRTVLIEVMSANDLPSTLMQQTGWWDVVVPEYFEAARSKYVERRGF